MPRSTESGIKKVSISPSSAKKCHRFNHTDHSPNKCKFKEATCHKCKGKGHIAPACRTKKALTVPLTEPPTTSGDTHKTHQMMSECPGVVESNSDDDEYLLYNFVGGTSKPLKVLLTVNGKPLYMELDTGADLSIISEATRKTLFPNLRIHKSTVTLKTYTGEPIRLVGNLHVRVKYKGQLSLLSSLWKAIDQVS